MNKSYNIPHTWAIMMTAQAAFIVTCVDICHASQDTTWNIRLTYVEGTVRTQKPGSEGWVKANSGQVVDPDDKIRTIEQSKAELTTSDGQIVRLGQLSVLSFSAPQTGDSSAFGGIDSPLKWEKSAAKIDPNTGLIYTETQLGTWVSRLDAEFSLHVGDIWSNSRVSPQNAITSFKLQLKQGEVLARPCPDIWDGMMWPLNKWKALAQSKPDTNKVTMRLTVANDSTCQIKSYSGKVKVMFSSIRAEADSLNRSRIAEWDSVKFKIPGGRISGVVFLDSYQKVVVSSFGVIAFKGSFSPDDIDEKTDWVEWNKERNKAIPSR